MSSGVRGGDVELTIKVSVRVGKLIPDAVNYIASAKSGCYSLLERICQPFQRSSATERPVLHPPSVRGAHRSVDPMELGAYLTSVSSAVGRMARAIDKDPGNPRHRMAVQALPHEVILTGMLLIIDGIRKETGSELSLAEIIDAGVEASHGIIASDVAQRLSGEGS